MSFADPQAVTIDGDAISVARVSSGDFKGGFHGTNSSGTGELQKAVLTFDISHAIGRRTRSTVRLRADELTADVLGAGLTIPVSMTAYLVLDVPNAGLLTVLHRKTFIAGLVDWLDVSGNQDKLLNLES